MKEVHPYAADNVTVLGLDSQVSCRKPLEIPQQFHVFPGNHNLNELPASRQPQDEKEVHQQKRRAADGYVCTGDQPTTQDNFGGMTMISSCCHIKVVTSLVS